MAPTRLTCSGKLLAMSIVSSKVQKPVTCRSSSRPNNHQSQNCEGAWPHHPGAIPANGRRGDRMNKREFITLLGGAAATWPLAARAQQTGRVWRVAVIGASSPLPAMLSAFREALQQRGWTEGKNLSIDVRWPKVSFTQEPGLISEVLHSNVDVIVAWATPTALAVRRATSTIPIVFLGISDPVGSGLAASLAHPGGNATGSSNLAPDLSAKLVGTFAQLVPGMSSVGVTVNPANPGAV